MTDGRPTAVSLANEKPPLLPPPPQSRLTRLSRPTPQLQLRPPPLL